MSGFEVRNEIAERALKLLGQAIKETVPPGMGFALLLFDYGPGGNMFYTSSANREDMVKAMQEFIQKHGQQKRPRIKRRKYW